MRKMWIVKEDMDCKKDLDTWIDAGIDTEIGDEIVSGTGTGIGTETGTGTGTKTGTGSMIYDYNKTIIENTLISRLGARAALKIGDISVKKHNSAIKYNYKIKTVKLDDIVIHDKAKYNSNNHWVGNVRPADYDDVLAQTNTSKWIDLFKEYKLISISEPVWLSWLKEACKVCSQTGEFSQLFEDEINEICSLIEKRPGLGPGLGLGLEIKQIFDGTGYFVRVNNVSLKYGQHKEGPYYSLRKILESVVSSIRGHTPINQDTLKLDIYLLPWCEIDSQYEFRVFVFKNKITAISQQNIYSPLINLVSTPVFEFEIKKKLDIIVEYFYKTVRAKVNWIDSYSIDIAIVNSQAYFIELNSFGKEYAAGSALFHWLLDEEILYNKFETNDDAIEFRYTVG